MPKYKPHEMSQEAFLKSADDFCFYSIRILKDEDICPKSARWLGADEIIRIIQRIHTQLHRANNIKVTNAEERNRRHALQTDAYALMATLGEKYVFCSRIYGIKTDKLTRWLTNKGEVQAWISSWMKSDEERYKSVT